MKFHSLLLLPSLLTLVSAAPNTTLSSRSLSSRAPAGNKNVIIQLFEWTFDSVAAECTAFIGPAGYGYVQVSPATEHITGSQWWTDYQVVSYQLTSKRGNRAQFANMVSTCHAAGVKVIHDTVLNHMAGIDGGVGTANSAFSHYNYPGIYQYTDFHHCGLSSGDDIEQWDNRQQVQTCELVNLADLATETEYVRSKLAQHVNDLISLGVDGIRIDAAKHVASNDISNILSRLTSRPYVTQEIVYGGQVQSSEFESNGDVQEFRFTWAIRDAFNAGDIAILGNLGDRGWTPSSIANVFVANHDTERSNGQNGLNANSPSNRYVLANIFTLAFPYGTPTILSSYSGFGDAGGPNGGYGTCSGSTGTNGWLCQHRWTSIAGMVGFRNTVGSTGITNWIVGPGNGNRLGFGRGSLGFVAINNADSAWSATFATSLPNGRYCDVVNGAKTSSTACSGPIYTVSAGRFTANIAARSALALHAGAVLVSSGVNVPAPTPTTTSSSPSVPTSSTVRVAFSDSVTTEWGQNIYLIGSIPALGNWNTASSVPLSSAEYPNWKVSIDIPNNTVFEYKFIRKNQDGSVAWEADPNRQATTASGGSMTLSSSWR